MVGYSSGILDDIRMGLSILRQGYARIVLHEVKRRFHSEDTYFGLRRDLSVPFQAGPAKISVWIRPARPDDIPQILVRDRGMTENDIKDYLRRLYLLKTGISTCYVAVTGKGNPCYMQWLMSPDENSRIQQYFKGGFPPLGPDEMLLEGALTVPAYRGLRIMSHAMAKIAEKAQELGARRVITYVCHDNFPALNGCKEAGFIPFTIRLAKWRRFTRTLNFVPLSSVPGDNIVALPRIFKSGP
jgi:GNAT superfamily N-acetyltransferase